MESKLIIFFFVSTLIIFFWSIYKAIKTQETKYAWGMVPFFLFMVGLFLL